MAFTLVKKLGIEPLFSGASGSADVRRGLGPAAAGLATGLPAASPRGAESPRARSSSGGASNRQSTPLIYGPHSLLLAQTSVDYYLLPNARIIAHYKGSATIALLDAVPITSTSANATQTYASPNSKPLILSASGDTLELIVILSNGSIALLSSKTSVVVKSTESKSKTRSSSPKTLSPVLTRANTELLLTSPSSPEDTSRTKSSTKSPRRKKIHDDKSAASEDKKSPRGDDSSTKASRDSESGKSPRRAKKLKDKSKSIDGKKEKESKKDKESKKERKVTPALDIPISASVKSCSSPSGSPSSPSVKRHKSSLSDSASKLDPKSDSEDLISEEASESFTRSSSTGRARNAMKRSATPTTLRGIAASKDDLDLKMPSEDDSGSRSGTPDLRRSGRVTPTSTPISRQSSMAALPSVLKRSQGSPSPGLRLGDALVATKSQWLQVLTIDPTEQSAFPSATLYPDVCSEMGGIRKLLPGPDGSLLIETENGEIFILEEDASIPRPLAFPEPDISLRSYHLNVVDGYILFLKNSAAEFVLCSLQKSSDDILPTSSNAGSSSSPSSPRSTSNSSAHNSGSSHSPTNSNTGDGVNSPKKKHKKSQKTGFFEQFKANWFSSSSVAAMQLQSDPESISFPPTLKPVIRAQSPEGATFLKFEVQKGLLMALTAVSLLTWEIGQSPRLSRIPLTLPIFALAVTRDRILTGDIDGNVTVYERATGRKQYMLNCPENLNVGSESSSGSHTPSSPSPLSVNAGSSESSGGTRARAGSDHRKMSIIDRMAQRVTQLYVLLDYYVVARFESGECSVWSLSASQTEPLQKIVKKPAASNSGRCGFTSTTVARGEDGTLCIHHSRAGTSKLRILRCKPPVTTYSTRNETVSAPFAASLISGELPGSTYRPVSDFREEIAKLSNRIYELHPWVSMLNEAVSVIDLQTTKPIAYVNTLFEKMTLYASEEVLGSNILFLKGKYTAQDSISKWRSIFESPDFCELEMLCYRKDGSPFFNHMTFLPIKHKKHSKITHLFLIHRDISHQKLIPHKAVEWSPVEVSIWLEESEFSAYGLTFLHKQVNGLTLLKADENYLLSIGVVRDDIPDLLKATEILRSHSSSIALLQPNTASGSQQAPGSGSFALRNAQRPMVKSPSSSSMSMSMELDSENVAPEDYSTSVMKRHSVQNGTLVKLDLNGKVAIFALKQAPGEHPWASLLANVEECLKEAGPFDFSFEDPLLGSTPVNETTWPALLSKRTHHLMHLKLTPCQTLQTPRSTPGRASSRESTPSSSSGILALASPKPLRLNDVKGVYASTHSYEVDSPLSETLSASTSLPGERMVRSASNPLLLSNHSPHQSPRGPLNRLEELFQNPEVNSRSGSRDLLPNRPSSSAASLSTSLSSISSLYTGESDESGKMGYSLRRCIDRTQAFSTEGAKTLERLFKRVEEQYPWLSSAKGAFAIVENNSLRPFIFINSEMERLTLFTKSQLLGRNYRILCCKATDPGLQAFLDFPSSLFSGSTFASTAGPALDIELVFLNASGLPFVCSLLAYPIFLTKDCGTIPSHLLCMHREVTSIKLQEVPPNEWKTVEVSAWIHQTEFSHLAKACYETGLTGSDLLAASENPRAIDLLGRGLGLTHVTQRVDFADLVNRLRMSASARSAAGSHLTALPFTSSPAPHSLNGSHPPASHSSNQSSGSLDGALPSSGAPSGSSEVAYSSSPVSPRLTVLIPPTGSGLGSPRALSSPIPTLQSPRTLGALKGALEQHQRRDEKTIVKLYLGPMTALLPITPSSKCSLDKLIQFANKSFQTSNDIELRPHTCKAPTPRHQTHTLDSESWQKLYQERRGKIIRLDVIEFNALGLPLDPYSPILFKDNAIANQSSSGPLIK
jgi:PAS domain S-box-containing protein